MRWFLVTALMFQTVSLGEGFLEASAVGVYRGSDQVEVTLGVATAGGGSMVAHLIEPGGEQLSLAMADIGGGRFQVVFDTRPIDLVVVFEAVGSGRVSVQSTPARLTELGLDPILLTRSVFPDSAPPVSEDGTQWVWLALGAGAAALALVAMAFLPKRKEATPTEESAA